MRWGTLLWCGVSRLPWLRACEAAFISLTCAVPFDKIVRWGQVDMNDVVGWYK